MLEFALCYRIAIDDIAGNQTAKLCRYELGEAEWKIAQQLCDMLKVWELLLSDVSPGDSFSLSGLQRHHTFLFMRHA
jgi:hypothetical protein